MSEATIPALREVRGPSALGGGRQRFFDLLWLMAVTEFKRVYFGTVLGYLWSLIRPLAFFGVLLFVFERSEAISIIVTSQPFWRAEAAISAPIHPEPTTTNRWPRSIRSPSRCESATVRR